MMSYRGLMKHPPGVQKSKGRLNSVAPFIYCVIDNQ